MFILTPQVVYAAARMVIPVPQENQRLTTYDLRLTTYDLRLMVKTVR